MDIFGTRQVKVYNPINYLEITFVNFEKIQLYKITKELLLFWVVSNLNH